MYLLSADVSWPRTENSQLNVSMAMPFFRALVCRRAVRKPLLGRKGGVQARLGVRVTKRKETTAQH